ncbi:MAG: ligase-associated DNA damage response endonuclease PdeM [Geminicoccaceae bacterium]|nr:ligase-associated DNA damage response endonuclease PdeM [Geminicoccaceae bacterium]
MNIAAPTTIRLAGETVLLDPSGAAFLPDHAILIVADLHLEKAAAFARRGALLPPYDSLATLVRLEGAAVRLKPRRIVSLGDGFHDSAGARLITGEAADRLEALSARYELDWLAGNHDPHLPSTLPGRRSDTLHIGRLTLRHLPDGGGADGTGICGHLHPKARIAGRHGTLRLSCFVHDHRRLLMPAFGTFTGGLNVLDPAIAGLFATGSRIHVMGEHRLHPASPARLRPDPADWRRHILGDRPCPASPDFPQPGKRTDR